MDWTPSHWWADLPQETKDLFITPTPVIQKVSVFLLSKLSINQFVHITFHLTFSGISYWRRSFLSWVESQMCKRHKSDTLVQARDSSVVRVTKALAKYGFDVADIYGDFFKNLPPYSTTAGGNLNRGARGPSGPTT